MNKGNLSIIEVKTYYEKAIVSTNNSTFKVAVLKVKYSDGNWETIFRNVLSRTTLTAQEVSFIEQYKTLDLNQIRQISHLLSNKEQRIFGLYLRKYLKHDLNIEAFVAKRNMRLYIENKGNDFLEMAKNVIQTITANLRKAKLYVLNLKSATNI